VNLFDAEPLIIARLKPVLTDLKTVDSFAIISGSSAITGYLPAVFVMADAGDVEQSGPNGTAPPNKGAVHEIQRWAIAVAVAYARDGNAAPSWLDLAGDIAARCIAALHNWTGIPDRRCLYEGREAITYAPGYLELMLRFSTRKKLEWP